MGAGFVDWKTPPHPGPPLKGRELAGAAGKDAEEALDVGVGADVAVAVEVGGAAGWAAAATEAGEEVFDGAGGAGVLVADDAGADGAGGGGGGDADAVAALEAVPVDPAPDGGAAAGVEQLAPDIGGGLIGQGAGAGQEGGAAVCADARVAGLEA